MPLQNSRRQRGLSCQNWDHRNRFRAFFSSYVQKEHKKTSIAFLLNSYSVVTYAFIHLVNVFQLIFVYLYNFRLFYIDDFSFVILNILAMHIGSIPLQFEYIYISYNVYIYIYIKSLLHWPSIVFTQCFNILYMIFSHSFWTQSSSWLDSLWWKIVAKCQIYEKVITV